MLILVTSSKHIYAVAPPVPVRRVAKTYECFINQTIKVSIHTSAVSDTCHDENWTNGSHVKEFNRGGQRGVWSSSPLIVSQLIPLWARLPAGQGPAWLCRLVSSVHDVMYIVVTMCWQWRISRNFGFVYAAWRWQLYGVYPRCPTYVFMLRGVLEGAETPWSLSQTYTH